MKIIPKDVIIDGVLPSTLLNKTFIVRKIEWLYPIEEPVKQKRKHNAITLRPARQTERLAEDQQPWDDD